MRHHTKDFGDIGTTQVLADLTKRGFQILLPISEHLPFDLVSVAQDMKTMKRISVKYRSVDDNGTITIQMRQTASNSRGMYAKEVNREEIDAFAVYCPDTDEVYYVDVKETLGYTSRLVLRVNDAARPINTIKWAKDYREPWMLFGDPAPVAESAE